VWIQKCNMHGWRRKTKLLFLIFKHTNFHATDIISILNKCKRLVYLSLHAHTNKPGNKSSCLDQPTPNCVTSCAHSILDQPASATLLQKQYKTMTKSTCVHSHLELQAQRCKLNRTHSLFLIFTVTHI
jgi:hypothetical protein